MLFKYSFTVLRGYFIHLNKFDGHFLCLSLAKIRDTVPLSPDINVEGDRGREPGKKGSGSRRREDGKRESLGGGNWEKTSKTSQHFFYNYFTMDMGQRGENSY